MQFVASFVESCKIGVKRGKRAKGTAKPAEKPLNYCTSLLESIDNYERLIVVVNKWANDGIKLASRCRL